MAGQAYSVEPAFVPTMRPTMQLSCAIRFAAVCEPITRSKHSDSDAQGNFDIAASLGRGGYPAAAYIGNRGNCSSPFLAEPVERPACGGGREKWRWSK